MNRPLDSAMIARRQFLSRTGIGFGAAALAVLDGQVAGAASPIIAKNAKAKRAIYLFMSGAPSHLDLWDPKPKLRDWYDQDLPPSIRGQQRLTTMTSDQTRLAIAPSPFKFTNHGDCGMTVSELLPHTAKIVDDLALIRTMHTSEINHDPAITLSCTGDATPGKASLGSWLSYGLGSENENLPAFMVMTASWSGRGDDQAIFSRLWGNGFLPGRDQGVRLQGQGEPFLYLNNPSGIDSNVRRRMLDSLAQLNREHFDALGDPETNNRIEQYEMAFRMQTSVPELADIRDEPQHVLAMYGREVTIRGTYANCCLMARRMAQRGVRFTQIFHRGWDHHSHLPRELRRQCNDIDQPTLALIKDLRSCGLLDDTLVIWGGEFGRTAYSQGKLSGQDFGRDHHPRCFSAWLAGAGVRGGHVHGETDEFGYNVAKDPVHVHDLNATILERFGIDHTNFVYPWQGLDQRLTGVEPAKVIRQVLAD